jgi:hypothetical protein
MTTSRITTNYGAQTGSLNKLENEIIKLKTSIKKIPMRNGFSS